MSNVTKICSDCFGQKQKTSSHPSESVTQNQRGIEEFEEAKENYDNQAEHCKGGANKVQAAVGPVRVFLHIKWKEIIKALELPVHGVCVLLLWLHPPLDFLDKNTTWGGDFLQWYFKRGKNLLFFDWIKRFKELLSHQLFGDISLCVCVCGHPTFVGNSCVLDGTQPQ